MALEERSALQRTRLRELLGRLLGSGSPFWSKQLAGVRDDAELAELPFTTKDDLLGAVPLRVARRAPGADGARARVLGDAAQADDRGVHPARHRDLRRGQRARHRLRGRDARGRPAQRVRLRPVHGRARPPLRRRAARGHRRPGLGRQQRPAGAAPGRPRRARALLHAVVLPAARRARARRRAAGPHPAALRRASAPSPGRRRCA